jgi:HD superfamily phosphohydrolase
MDIKDPIHGSIPLSQAEANILDTAAFQRLRQIKQLGFAEFSFPGATHNRFIHSLGVMHLAGLAFDTIFKNFPFSSTKVSSRFRQCVRLGALLHDLGHGPLSHTTEEVMPKLSLLKVDAYKHHQPDDQIRFDRDGDRKANHEDYTIKFLTDSPLTEELRRSFPDLTPFHVACLVDRSLQPPDDFFMDKGLNFRTILSQLVSSELDADRMDYLERDSYFCGTNYGKVERSWLLGNLTYHQVKEDLHLALDRRALYTFDDFLISRHHMYLMVYFHHKSIIYEEMLYRYLTSKDCTYFLSPQLEEYCRSTDYSLYEHLAASSNEWAQRITQRRPYRMVFELHAVEETTRTENMRKALEDEGLHVIMASSQARLSKYHMMSAEEKSAIFVVDQYDTLGEIMPIEQSTGIFRKYEETRSIERLYVAPENYTLARDLIFRKRL